MAKQKAPPKGVLTYKEFFGKLSKDMDAMKLIVMYGDEPYLIEGTISMLRKKLIAEGAEDMDMSVIDTRTGSKFSFDILSEMASSPAWMSSKRLVVVRKSGIFDKECTDEALNALKNIPDGTVVVFAEDSIDSRKKMFKNVVSFAVITQMNKMDLGDCTSWIKGKFNKMGLEITTDAQASLASRCDMSLSMLAREINKVALYCRAENISKVDFDTVDAICPPDLSSSIFDIMDACGSGDAVKAMGTLDKLIRTREPVQRINTTIVNHLRKLIVAKDTGNPYELKDRLGIMPFQAEKFLREASSFTMPELINLYRYAVNADSNVKHGEMDDLTSLEILVMRACKAI
ncbi:MAG: DNA polymerase III subunit delta [Saccharofermentans sp.]|nr:DNA polymerase III subunit delta [Saccharofermentans sp.]